MDRYRVDIARTMVETCTLYVWGADEVDAARNAEVAAAMDYEKWEIHGSDQDLSVAKLDQAHEVLPVGTADGTTTLCKACLMPVRWTGTPADKSPTGLTIPGPWVHTEGGE